MKGDKVLYTGMTTYVLDKGLIGPYTGLTLHNLEDLRNDIREDLAAEREVLLFVPWADTVLDNWQIGPSLCELLTEMIAEPKVTILASTAEEGWSADDYVAGLTKVK